MRDLVVRALVAFVCLSGTASGESESVLHCPRTSSSLVLMFSETPGGLSGNGLTLRVYGNGRFTVLRPPHEKDAGEWVGQLSSDEMEALCKALVARRVHMFDARAVRAAKRAGGGRRTWIATDPEATRFVVQTRVQHPDGSFTEGTETVSWIGLAADARQHPEIAALQDLAAIAGELRALTRDPRLQPAP